MAPKTNLKRQDSDQETFDPGILEYINTQIQAQVDPLKERIQELEKALESASGTKDRAQQTSYEFNPIAKFKFLSTINESTLNSLRNKSHSELYRIFASVVITQTAKNYSELTNTSSLNELMIKNALKLFEAMNIQLPVHEEIELCQVCSQLVKQVQQSTNSITLATPAFNTFVNTIERALRSKPGVTVESINRYTKSIRFPNQYSFKLDHTELYQQNSRKSKTCQTR